MAPYGIVGTEVYQCYSIKWPNIKLPEIGKTCKSTVSIPKNPKEIGEIGLLRLDEYKFSLYMVTTTLHKFGLVVKRLQCLIKCNWRHPFDLSGKHTSHTCPEIILENIDTVENSAIQIFTGEVTLNLPDDKRDCAIEIKLSAEIGSCLEVFQGQVFDCRLPKDLWNSMNSRYGTDAEFIVNGRSQQAHKFILASRSPVVAHILAKNPNQSIEIDASWETFGDFLNFIYTGELAGPVNEELARLARKFQVKTLEKICDAAKAVDYEVEILRLDSINEELKMYADKRQKLMESNIREYEVPIELTQRVGYIRPFPDDLLHWSPEKKELNLEAQLNSSDPASEYTTVIRHCKEIKLETNAPYMRWSFEDSFRNFTFFATIHENQDPDSYVDISLRVVQRGLAFEIVKVLFLIHIEPYQRVIRPKTQIGELVASDTTSEIRRWKGKAYGWKNQCDLPTWLPQIEFLIYGKEGTDNFRGQIVDGSLLNDFASDLKQRKWTDVEFTIGDKKFAAHRAVLAARSSTFAKILQDQGENESSLLSLPNEIADLKSEIFSAILSFIYRGKLVKSPLDEELLNAAEKLGIPTLVDLCKESRNSPSDCEPLLNQLQWS